MPSAIKNTEALKWSDTILFCLSDKLVGKLDVVGSKRSVSNMFFFSWTIMVSLSSPMPVSIPFCSDGFSLASPFNRLSLEPSQKNSLNTIFHISTSFPFPFLQYISVVGPQGPELPVGPQKTSSIPSSRTSVMPSDCHIFLDSSSLGTAEDPSNTVT